MIRFLLDRILDDKELYEQEKPFSIEDLIQISAFLNQLLFRIVICKQMDLESSESLNHLTSCLHSLLTLLIRRDSRREFAPKNHWLIKDLKVSALIKDLEAGKKQAAQLLTKLPHAIPHKERVQLFRQYVITEKAELGLTDLSNASPHPTLIKGKL